MVTMPLTDAGDASEYGGKASSLAQLLQAGFQIPPGFVVPAGQTLGTESEAAITDAFDSLGSQFVAVRSSAIAEDSKQASWAGQLETVLNVTRDNLLKAIRNCQASAHSERAEAYATQNRLSAGDVAVIVQAMVQSKVSGVAFSAHPVTKDPQQIVIEAVFGLGEALVSGMVTPDTYVVAKPAKLLEKYIGQQPKQLVKAGNTNDWKPLPSVQGATQKLTEPQINTLSDLIISLEQFYGFPVDVEWALVDDNFYILQCRPITTLG